MKTITITITKTITKTAFKTALILISVVSISCSSKTQFQIKNGLQLDESNKDSDIDILRKLNGTMYATKAYMYVNDELAGDIYVGDIAPSSESAKITVPNNVDKIRIVFKFMPDDIEFMNEFKVLVGYRYMEQGKTTAIFVDAHSSIKDL